MTPDISLFLKVPRAVKVAGIVTGLFALVLAGLAVKSHFSTSSEPRIQPFQDMGVQPKIKAQNPSRLFADGRGNRLPPGARLTSNEYQVYTVARGAENLRADDAYYRGRDEAGNFVMTIPDQVPVTNEFIQRGRERYTIYCAPCHGLSGTGNGPVKARVDEIGAILTIPANITDDTRRAKPDGHFYDVIANGYNNMAAYGSQIAYADRWAIVAWVRVLQKAQHASVDDVPEENDKRAELLDQIDELRRREAERAQPTDGGTESESNGE
jgi:mono/diheme cytochrome c family protein